MNAGAFVVAAFFLTATLYEGRREWLFWRLADSDAPTVFLARYFGRETRRGLERAGAAYVASLAFVTLLMLAGGFVPGTRSLPDPARYPAIWIALVALIGMFACIVAQAAIVWVNRPAFLVPPHLRDEAGTLTTWWRHRRNEG